MYYRGELEDFPPEIVADMLFYQVMQGSPLSTRVFEEACTRDSRGGGFTWSETPEGHTFWCRVIEKKDFDLFFEKYPKNESN